MEHLFIEPISIKRGVDNRLLWRSTTQIGSTNDMMTTNINWKHFVHAYLRNQNVAVERGCVRLKWSLLFSISYFSITVFRMFIHTGTEKSYDQHTQLEHVHHRFSSKGQLALVSTFAIRNLSLYSPLTFSNSFPIIFPYITRIRVLRNVFLR